jgi:hypothetical protein
MSRTAGQTETKSVLCGFSSKTVAIHQPTRFLTFPTLTIIKPTFHLASQDKESFPVA